MFSWIFSFPRNAPTALSYIRHTCFFLFFFPFHLLSSPLYVLVFFPPPSRHSYPGSRNRLFSPPTHYGSWLAFLSREDFSSSSLVDSRRIVLTHARGARSSWSFSSFFFANKFKISPRRDSNSRTNTNSIRGLPLVHRGDRVLEFWIPFFVYKPQYVSPCWLFYPTT